MEVPVAEPRDWLEDSTAVSGCQGTRGEKSREPRGGEGHVQGHVTASVRGRVGGRVDSDPAGKELEGNCSDITPHSGLAGAPIGAATRGPQPGSSLKDLGKGAQVNAVQLLGQSTGWRWMESKLEGQM